MCGAPPARQGGFSRGPGLRAGGVLYLDIGPEGAIADMLPGLREQARQRAVESVRKELKEAEQKFARLVAGPLKQT